MGNHWDYNAQKKSRDPHVVKTNSYSSSSTLICFIEIPAVLAAPVLRMLRTNPPLAEKRSRQWMSRAPEAYTMPRTCFFTCHVNVETASYNFTLHPCHSLCAV